MEIVNIPFGKVETRINRGDYSDGTVSKIKNLVPSGSPENLSWKPIEIGGVNAKGYPFGIQQDLPALATTTVLSRYYQERKYKEQGTTKTDTSRWLILIRDSAGVGNIELYATKVDGGEHRIDGAALCSFDSEIYNVGLKFKWVRINAQDVALNIYTDTNAYLFFIIGDSVYDGFIHDKENTWGVVIKSAPYSAVLYPNGGFPGFLPVATRYFSIMLVWKLKSTGTYIKHTTPKIIELAADSLNTYWPEFFNIDDGFVDSVLINDPREVLGAENPVEVDGVYVALSIGYGTRDDAFQTSNYYVIGLMDSFEISAVTGYRMVKVEEDKIATFEYLNIDPFSRHITSSRILGNYRKNLLLGDVLTNFAAPGSEWWISEPLTDPTLAVSLLNQNYTDIWNDWVRTGGVTRSLFGSYTTFRKDTGTTGTAYTTFTPINITDDIIIVIVYDIASAGTPFPELEITGAGITTSPISYDFDIDGGVDGTSTLTITIPSANLSSTALITLTAKLTAETGGTAHYLELYSVLVYQSNLGLRTDYDIAQVTINTDQGEFVRFQKVRFYEISTLGLSTIYLPETLSYPDRRATEIKLWRETTTPGEWIVYHVKTLKPHASLNFSFENEGSRVINMIDVILTGDEISTEITNYVGQEINSRRPEVWKASNLNEYDLPLERTYTMNSPVVGFVDNTQETGSGQFAQFPLVILCERNISGAESQAGSFVSRIESISDENGVHSENAFAIYKNALWFASKAGLHVLSGNSVIDIFDQFEKYNADSNFLSTLLQVDNFYIGVSEEKREVVFTDGQDYLFVWNTQYNAWYEGQVIIGAETCGELIQIGTELYLTRQATNTAIDGSITKWRDGSDPVDVVLNSNPFIISDYAVNKRINKAILRARIKTPAGQTFLVKLSGKKTNMANFVELMSYNIPELSDVQNLPFRSNIGSMQEFILEMDGQLDSETYIKGFVIEVDVVRSRINP